RELGVDPVTEQPIRLMDGRYGPYVKCGSTNASIGKGVDPDALTLETAIELIRAREKAPKKKRPARRKKAAPKKKKK
ncbi:MAG: topoisomerase C-terminal repeat-containing protein, partial [Myxococcota bacterium]